MLKKLRTTLGIIIIVFVLTISFHYFAQKIRPWCGCEFRLEEDYKISVDNEEEALNLLDEYLVQHVYSQNKWLGFKKMTTEEITIFGNEFIAKNRGIKIDKDGKLYAMDCVPLTLPRCIWQLITRSEPY